MKQREINTSASFFDLSKTGNVSLKGLKDTGTLVHPSLSGTFPLPHHRGAGERDGYNGAGDWQNQIIEIKRVNSSNRNEAKQNIRGLLGPGDIPVLNSNTQLHFKTKSVVYSYKKVNNLYPLLTKTEYLLKCIFQSMFSLISKPVYLLNHDKIIIRLFVFLSPKLDKYLDTTTRSFRDISSIVYYHIVSRGSKGLTYASLAKGRAAKILIKNLKKIKSIRPQTEDILKDQIKFNHDNSFGAGIRKQSNIIKAINSLALQLSIDKRSSLTAEALSLTQESKKIKTSPTKRSFVVKEVPNDKNSRKVEMREVPLNNTN